MKNDPAKRKLLIGTALCGLQHLAYLSSPRGLAFAQSPPSANDVVRIGGTGSGLGGIALLADAFLKKNPTARIEILPSVGSSGGIRALIDSRLDITLSNRTPNEAESKNQLTSTEFARTAFVVAVHQDLGIRQLTTAELVRLYSENSATFPNGKRARPVLRSTDATDTALLKLFSPELSSAIDAASKRRGLLDASTDTECADLIEKTPGAFGPLSLGLIVSEKRPLVALTIDKFKPSVAALESGEYPFYKRLFMIQSPRSNPLAQRFSAFVQSTEGRKILSSSGHATV